MTVKVLESFSQLCKQESTGIFLMQGNIDRSLDLQDSGTLTQGGDPEGIEFYVRVQYANATTSIEWENMVASYTFDGTNYRLERQRTITGSSGTTAINFSSADESLVVFGIPSHELFNSIRTLQAINNQSATNYSTSDNANIVALSDEFVISPTDQSSVLSGDVEVNLRLEAVVVGDDMRGRASMQYMNSLGAWVDFGINHLIGYLNLQNVTSVMTTYTPTVFKVSLSSSQLDPSNDWRIRIAGKPDTASVSLKTFAVNTYLEEKTT